MSIIKDTSDIDFSDRKSVLCQRYELKLYFFPQDIINITEKVAARVFIFPFKLIMQNDYNNSLKYIYV